MDTTDSSFDLFDLSERSDCKISRSVNRLIQSIVRDKTIELDFQFHKEIIFLPKSVYKIHMEQRILSTNLKIEELRYNDGFDRKQEIAYHKSYKFDNEKIDYDSESGYSDYISECIESLSDQDYNTYVYAEFEEEEIDAFCSVFRSCETYLPSFHLITDFLSQMSFFDNLISDYEDFNNGLELLPPSEKYRFRTSLKEEQITNLYNSLISNGFISPDTNKDDFLWSFGVDKSTNNYNIILWLESKSLAVYFIDTLSAFGFFLKTDKIWSVGYKLFGINKMAQIKQNYISYNKSGKPKGFEKIDNIISSI